MSVTLANMTWAQSPTANKTETMEHPSFKASKAQNIASVPIKVVN